MKAGEVLFFLCLAFVVFHHTQCAKRSWLGPNFFFDGVVPSARYSQGLASIGSKLYIFGGIDQFGEFGRPGFEEIDRFLMVFV